MRFDIRVFMMYLQFLLNIFILVPCWKCFCIRSSLQHKSEKIRSNIVFPFVNVVCISLDSKYRN